ncbi:MAG: ChbG/HpnK family deacetylase [Candidatus Omnitrophota bacterium]
MIISSGNNRAKSFFITGDDFGLSREINAGMIGIHQKGNLDGVSLMANGEAFDDAVSLIKQHPDLDVGLHLTLVELTPLLSGREVPSLVDKNGFFYADYSQFLRAYILGKIRLREIDQEIGAQFEKVQRQGVRITRIDSHQQLHMVPGILDIVIKHALKYHVARIRYPYTPLRFNALQFSAHPDKFLGNMLLNGLCLYQGRLLKKYRMIHPDHYCNASNAGGPLGEVLQRFQKTRKSGSWEFSFHPAISEHELSKRYPHWRYHWEQEYHEMMRPDFRSRFEGSHSKNHAENSF